MGGGSGVGEVVGGQRLGGLLGVRGRGLGAEFAMGWDNRSGYGAAYRAAYRAGYGAAMGLTIGLVIGLIVGLVMGLLWG